MSTPKKSSKSKRHAKHSLLYCRGRRIARDVAGRNHLSEAALTSLEGGMNEFLNRLVAAAIETMKPSEVCIKPRHVVAGLGNHPNMMHICANQMHSLRVKPVMKAMPVRRAKKTGGAKPKK